MAEATVTPFGGSSGRKLSNQGSGIGHESIVNLLDRLGVEGDRRKKIKAESDLSVDDFVCPLYRKSESARKFLIECLASSFVFETLTDKERDDLISAMQKQTSTAGTDIITQGDIGDYFYVVDSGSVSIIVDGTEVGTVARGGSFGELALLYNCPRSATCKAATEVTMWKIDQRCFRSILMRSAQNATAGVTDILRKVPLLSGLGTSELQTIADTLVPTSFAQGRQIVTKGEIGRVFYIIKEGQLRVHDIGSGSSEFAEKILLPGDYFGEIALVTGEPRTANVTALTDSVLLCLSGNDFKKYFGGLDELMKKATRKRVVSSIPSIASANLRSEKISILVDSFAEKSFEAGILVKAGGPLKEQGIHIIESGAVRIIADDGVIVNLTKGDHFGGVDIKFKEGMMSKRTIEFLEPTKCSVLSKQDIIDVIGSIERLGKAQSFSRRLSMETTLDKLTVLGLLGQGAFGKVSLVEEKSPLGDDKPPQQFAMKMLSKRQLIATKQTKAIIREKNIMMSVSHSLILKLHSTFQDESNLYMVLDVVKGGELFEVLHDRTKAEAGMPYNTAKFMAACVFESLSHIHSRYIVFRDLKPENILVDENGYCILIDFGFATVVMDKTFTMCGTPEYLAPELLLSKGYDKSADIWGMGVLIYELLAGKTPFFARGLSEMQMFRRIVRSQFIIPRTKKFTDEANNMIGGLLKRLPAERLGCLAAGSSDVKNHAYFEGIDWEALAEKKLKAPWCPPAKKTTLKPSEPDNAPTGRKLKPEEQALFVDFGAFMKN